jgi:hypothetical protein
MKTMPKKLTVTWTDEDLAVSQKGSCTRCVWSTAVKRLLPGSYVMTRPNILSITRGGFIYRYSVPGKALQTIFANDDVKIIHPAHTRTATFLWLETRRATLPAATQEERDRRQKQVNDARRKRLENGKPDKRYTRRSFTQLARRAA